jgi:hypothetical protein
MTAFAAADIPADITTIEQLYAWTAIVLTSVNPTLTAIEGPGLAERVSQSNIYYIPADNKTRLLTRVSLELEPAYLGGGKHMWTYVVPLSDTALPAHLKKA